MKLFIGNTTKQHFDFSYRIPENPSPRTQRIPIGGQIQISGELNTSQIDSIVGHHKNYGLVAVDEIDRTKPFIGLCYSVDKPISVDKLTRAIRHNTGVLIERGKEIRRDSAVAESNRIESQLQEDGSPANLQNYEMSVVEENPDERSDIAPIAEGTRVNRHDPETNAGRNRKGGRR